ncbi:MAG: phytoene desaturase [Chitinivibrionales bacterium]|nr:phytoene desaturase [Chitinivibrionales bacterium]MBD3356447.1 phytoene desaturase [Chitinivibrionales bacterium]
MATKDKHIVVVGAGPGGLSAAMILANRGYRVSVYERDSAVGGRNRTLRIGKYTFDTGPTFLMMDFFLREIFTLAGRNIGDYLDMVRLEPMYKLSFKDCELLPTTDHNEMKRRLAQVFPGDEEGIDHFMAKEAIRYDKLYPCLRKDYSTFGTMFHRDIRRALPHLNIGKTLYQNLGTYFSQEECKVSFTFQAKYLGMSPWDCPALFTIIPYVEHAYGVFHVTGGLSRISEAMAEVVKEHGGSVNCGRRVERVVADKRTAKGVLLEGGERVDADAVVVNADFGYAAENLFEPGFIKKYTPAKLSKMKYSCSTFMLYLGLNKVYDEPHHNIIFAEDYRRNITEISNGSALSQDMSIYVRNASVTDGTLAPRGHSALYILVPVPNMRADIKWDSERIQSYRERVLDRICARTSMSDLRKHIVAEKIITPEDWQYKHYLYRGATFNLGHNLMQVLYFRPHNRFEECRNCYLVGGGTHPGSGLPTIYESGRISANLISEDIR